MDISIKVTYKSEGLQKLRKAAGLSQSQLADLAGIKVQVLQQYERAPDDRQRERSADAAEDLQRAGVQAG